MKLIPSLCLFLGSCLLASAAPITFGLPRSTPEAQGIPSAAILQFIETAEAKIDAVHSFMLVRHGQVVAEGWWAPFTADQPHALFSLTKSFTGTAVGLAVAEGRLNLDDPVVKFFPDEAPAHPSDDLQAMTVRDVLRMATGHEQKDIDAAFNRVWPLPAPNLVQKFFALPIVHKPGTEFSYDSLGSHVLSAIVQKVTGQTTHEYLRARLFAPLGISDPQWDESGQGVSFGCYGLHLRTEDIAKFGQLYLQHGQWQGKQLVPAAWVEAATAKQTDRHKVPPNPQSDWEQGYGYQFWRCRHGFYRGDGAKGQFCIVMPQYDAVLAITSGTPDMAGVMDLAWDTFIPAFKDGPLPADPAAADKLIAKEKTLALRHRTGLSGY